MIETRSLLPLLPLRGRVQGARVLCVGAGSEEAELLRAWGAAGAWALPGPWELARRAATAALGGEGADWIVVSEAEGLPVREVAEQLAPGGRVVVSLEAEDGEALAAAYRELLGDLRSAFPSVQLYVRHRSLLEVLAPLDAGAAPEVLGDWEGQAEVRGYLFVCGPEALALGRALLVPRPLPVEREAEGSATERELERLRRRCRDESERAEHAELRAEEAEGRWSEAERRADRAEAERAELAVALRRLEHELEMALRNQEALAGTLAEERSTSGS